LAKGTAVVVESPALLADVCGANDTNLRVIEELLDTRIRSRGNELFLEGGGDRKREILVRILDEVQEHLSLGQSPGPDLIRAVHASITEQDGERTELLKTNTISIPNGSKVFPRSYSQAVYVQGMDESEMVFGIGPAGTGKTYLAVAHALSEVLARRKRKLILTRPVVEAGESLGYLPGDLTQKISPYLRPLYDAMESLVPVETLRRMEENRIIEVAPLAYMRGRSLKECYIILDEAQNTTREQMKMFLTRIGEESKAIITGDITQIDLPRKNTSGLLHATRVLGAIREIHFSYFSTHDVVRNPLIKKIIDAYEGDDT
jgi:phosphate starvation-inducible PhoH-like protein